MVEKVSTMFAEGYSDEVWFAFEKIVEDVHKNILFEEENGIKPVVYP